MNQVASLLLQKMECEVHCQRETYLYTEPKSTVILFSKFILLPWQIYLTTWWKYFWHFTSYTEFSHFYKFLTRKLADILVHAVIVIHNVFCPFVASFLQKYESDMNFVLIEIRSFPQPVSYLWGLDPKSFRISLAWLQMTHGLSLGSGDVIVLALFGRVTRGINDKRSGSSGFLFVISTSCYAQTRRLEQDNFFLLILSSCT